MEGGREYGKEGRGERRPKGDWEGKKQGGGA